MDSTQPVSKQRALEDAIEHFDGDEMAADTFLQKYAVQLPQDKVGEGGNSFLETSPEDMWERMAKQGASVEDNPGKWEEKFYDAFTDWKVVPQGSIMFALGNPHQKSSSSNCFVEGTTVHTVNQGVKNIEDVEEGDQVVTHNGNVEDVVQTHKNKLDGRQVYHFKAFQSPEVKVTGNHGVWSISQEQLEWGEEPQWNDVKYLRKGDWVAMPNNSEGKESISVDLSDIDVPTSFEDTEDSVWYELDYDEDSIELISKYYYGDKEDENIHSSNQQSSVNRFVELDEDFAFFLGVWLGDGCVYSGNRPIKGISFTFSENEEELAEWVVDYISEAFNYEANIKHNSNQSTYQINVTCPIIGWFMNHYFGRGVRSKNLWERCHEWDKSCVESLVAGLVSSDGTVTKVGEVRVVTVNRTLMRDVYNLVRSKGIPIGYSESKRDTNFSDEVETARISFSRNHPIVSLVTKYYDDSRIEDSISKEFQPQQLKKINGRYFVRLNEKEKIEIDDDYVYTFGVKNDHSYSVAGLNFQNCFVIPIKDDSIEGLFDTAKEIARTYSYRGGVGTDISILRPKGSVVHNCSRTSTGAVSFMDFYSYITNLIGQNGRRGALMLTISDSHPDLYHPEADGMDFINIKRDLDKVTGANISVRISDAFMEAVEKGDEWTLSWERKNNKVYVGDEFIKESKGPDIRIERSYPAQDIWDNIVESATESAEPGVMFWDRIKEQSPADQYAEQGYKTVSSNPCVPGNTWVLTDQGPKRVSEIEGCSSRININGNVECSPTGSFVTGHKECYKIKTSRGYEFEATENHRIKVSDGYKEVGELSIDDTLELNEPKESQWSGRGNEDEGWLLGFYIGDGVVSDKVQPRIALYDEKKQLFDKANNIVQELGVRSDFEGKEHGNKIIVKTACLRELAEDFGIDTQRAITDEIHKASSEFYRGFISGYFDADGTVLDGNGCRKSVRLSSVNLDVLKDVQRMLLRMGIVSSIYQERHGAGKRKMPDGKGGKKEYDCKAVHELVITKQSIVKFRDKVGFNLPDKKEKLDNLIDGYSKGPYSDSFETNVESIENVGTKKVYDITVENEHEFSANGVRVHNCSEIPLSEYGACTLLSMNLTEFVDNPFTENARINGRKLHNYIETATRFLDNVKSIDAEKVPLEQQKKRALEARRIGIGTHGLGDMLAMLGLEYDSNEAIEQCDKLYNFIKNKVYQSSAKLAEEKGTFPIYDEDKHFQSPFIQRLNSKTKSMIKKKGLRNIACLTLAPTGTVSMLSQTSSGIEPIFRLQYERNVRNGGEVETYEVNHHLVDDYLDSHHEAEGIEDLPDCFQTVKDIDYVKRTELQGVIQKHIDHAISNTINIPADEENLHEIVSNSYKQAWRNGCKGYTVYVDGSREEAPLQSGEQEPEQVSDNLEYKADTKVWEAKDDYGHYFITEGLDQVFVNGYSSTAGRLNPDTIELADNMESVLRAHVDDERVDKYVERAGFDSIEKVARLTSLALKTNNADKVKVFFEQFSDRTSLATRLNEIFEYRKIEQTEVCQECGSDNLKYTEGCKVCLDCGADFCSI